MQQDSYLKVNIPSFANISALASILDLKEKQLISLSDNVSDFYKPGKILEKKNGDPRLTHDAKQELKLVHEKIKNRILKQVEYPYYMLGGISDPKNPRSCRKHAEIHCGKKILISEDISNFYPSTTFEIVKNIWKYCFKFSSSVSERLAHLTTYKNELPQGWKASGYIANLALQKYEPLLVKSLERKGFTYSRFIDDITVSSSRALLNEDMNFIISNVYKMLLSSGYKPKRAKHDISSKNKQMVVTSLNVNKRRPTIPRKERNNIRTMVFQIEQRYQTQGRSYSYYKNWLSVYGKVNRVKSFHEREGVDLQKRMRDIKPPKHYFSRKNVKDVKR